MPLYWGNNTPPPPAQVVGILTGALRTFADGPWPRLRVLLRQSGIDPELAVLWMKYESDGAWDGELVFYDALSREVRQASFSFPWATDYLLEDPWATATLLNWREHEPYGYPAGYEWLADCQEHARTRVLSEATDARS
jgi:hypothetical protein